MDAAELRGQALSRAGAISLSNNLVTIGLQPVASILTASGAITFCAGENVVLSGNIDGVWNTGETTTSITVTTGGDFFVTNTTDCGSEESNHIFVTVNPLPICTITGDNSICEGESTQLCVTESGTYLWSTGATTSCITVDTEGVYSVTVTSTAGCESICSATVVVNPLPVCNITGDLSICLGESTELCVTGVGTYLWSTGATTSCITANTAGVYSVTVTSIAGCESICSATVVVNPLPLCNITGDLFICAEGQSTELCVTGVGTYLWSTGATTSCITVSEAGTYSVTVTSTAGCESICSATVVVNPNPVCNITGDLSICLGESTELCVTGEGSYLWSTGATTSCITVSEAGTYSVTVTSTAGCESMCSATLVVNPLPVCNITGDLFICAEGQITELCVTGEGSYLWSTGETTNCITVSAAGVYSVTITGTGGCVLECEHLITTSDTTIPVIIACPDNIQIECLGDVPNADTSLVSAFDVCSDVYTVHLSDVATGNDCFGAIERTYRSYDSSGNFVDCVQTISYADTTAPIFVNPPTAVILSCENIPTPEEVTATDNCSNAIVTVEESVIVTNCDVIIQRVYTATDDCGNTTSVDQLVHILDTIEPTVEANLDDFEVECDAVIPAAVTPSFDDNCDDDLTIVYDSTITYLNCGYTITRTWTAYDDCENSVSTNQVVTIVDTEAPTLYPFQLY